MKARIGTTRRVHALLPAPFGCSLPPLLSFAGLAAVIVGILAMHVWMGGHGATAHHGAGPATSSSTVSSPAARIVPPTTTGRAPSSDTAVPSGHTHVGPTGQVPPAMTSSGVDPSDDGVSTWCGADCADEMVLGMCALAMVLVGMAWIPTPTARVLSFSLIRRGPPMPHWPSRPAPRPSLIQLCISRT